jgi:DNA polymerase V
MGAMKTTKTRQVGKAAVGARRVEIPFMGGAVVAGFPSPAEQYVDRPLDLNELLVARPAATYFVRAEGDSMEGAGIKSGDLLVVDRSLEVEDGAVVIACVDGEFTVKTFRRGRGGVRLEAANPAYKPIRFKGEMELRVFGVVTAVIHRFGSAPSRAEAG